ncbi:cytochrome P450 [Cupriavidus basilensis]|uniref:Cytochrome P450 n=1 Tax=Cupriavidus basilensis TaxID=68895 RepID=A0ABT6AVL6_9BURK|nr:cytochrome P450 [Cupriavidus basilensis]MDF3836628.1 cytochrome P450 [Cupriavidus basilensis]
MNTSSPPDCPFHAGAPSHPPALHPPGVWPPGPTTGLTGWRLLRSMSRDLLGTLATWQRAFGDVVHVRIWPEHQIVVTDPQLARELLVTHHDALIRWERGMRVFAQLHGHSVLIAEGDAWRGKRHALQPGFSPKAVQALVPTIASAAMQALSHWPMHAGNWPIENALTSLAMDVIVRTMFSSEIGADARIAEAAARTVMVAANAEFYWPASWPDAVPWKRAKRQALAALNGLVDRHLQARLKLPHDAWPDDLASRLLQLHRDDAAAWPLQAVHDECMTAFLAGHETAAATLAWWAWCMAANPAAQTAAREEVLQVLQDRAPTAETLPSLRYLTQTLHEALRLYPAAPMLNSRRSTRPITLGSWQLPARTQFLVPVQLMHHDPRWFPAPLAFRPERFGPGAPAFPRGAYLPFGAGPRVCLGQHLAMTETTAIAAMILQRFALSAPDGMAAPQPVFNVTLRPKQPLRLRLAPAPSAAPRAGR